MLPQSTDSQLKELKTLDRKIFRLGRVKAVLEWDQETNLPTDGVDERSEQLALLEGYIHDLQTSSLIGALTSRLADTTLPTEEDRALVRLHKRSFERISKLPKELVERRARLVGQSQAAWAQARKEKNFAQFAPYLKQIVSLSRETAELLGYQDHPYDALLEDYEPFATSAEVKEVFDILEPGVADLVRRIGSKPQVRSDFLTRSYPKAGQETVGRKVVSDLGFDWKAGRLDVTTHPFCTTLGPRDVRLTTRYDENYFPTALYGMVHESGHGLYEQGFDPRLAGSILANGTSLGIHESQSRFWENMVGRSQAFVDHYFPLFQQTFPQALGDISAGEFYRGINRVEPSFIRVEADEVTYSLHIILRFRLEMALLDGSLAVEEVPGAWNDMSEKLLGIRPGNDAQGCLQDIHWAMGGLGYFPTYALGNLYAAQFRRTLAQALPDWENHVRTGNFAPLLGWLRDQVHRWGSVYPAGELCRRVTGEKLSPQPFLDYLNTKYGGIYGV